MAAVGIATTCVQVARASISLLEAAMHSTKARRCNGVGYAIFLPSAVAQ